MWETSQSLSASMAITMKKRLQSIVCCATFASRGAALDKIILTYIVLGETV